MEISNIHALIGSYLSNLKQYVSVLGENSDELTVLFGVPQGFVLGPLLFIIYINDIYNSVDFGKFVLFANDTNIFVAEKCKIKEFEKANKVLKSINDFMKCNLLLIKNTPFKAIFGKILEKRLSLVGCTAL